MPEFSQKSGFFRDQWPDEGSLLLEEDGNARGDGDGEDDVGPALRKAVVIAGVICAVLVIGVAGYYELQPAPARPEITALASP